MGPAPVSAEQLLQRAIANGYEHGAHHAEDSVKEKTTYVEKTLKDQKWALGRFEKSV